MQLGCQNRCDNAAHKALGLYACAPMLLFFRQYTVRRAREAEDSNSGTTLKAADEKEVGLEACGGADNDPNSGCEPSSSERVTGANTPSGGSGYGNSKAFNLDVSLCARSR